MELTDGIVTLRPPGLDDAGWVTDSCRDPETQRWLPGLPSPYGPADAAGWLDVCARAWETGDAAPFVITAAVDGERLGVIEIRFGSPADVGYWAAPAGRGRGAVTRALVLIAAYGFGRGLERIELFTLPDNVRSQAVALRAGFVRDGSVPEKIPSRDGVSYDAFRFTLTRGALPAAGAAAGA